MKTLYKILLLIVLLCSKIYAQNKELYAEYEFFVKGSEHRNFTSYLISTNKTSLFTLQSNTKLDIGGGMDDYEVRITKDYFYKDYSNNFLVYKDRLPEGAEYTIKEQGKQF